MAKGAEKPKAPKGYTEQGGNVLSWDAGEIVEGIYLGMTPPRNEDSSPVIRIQTAEGLCRYWCPTILESKLADVEGGTAVVIHCLGKVEPVKSRGGSLAWGFTVFTKDGSGKA